MPISQYAKENNFTTNYVYNLVRTGKNVTGNRKFKIVVFNTYNFIVPQQIFFDSGFAPVYFGSRKECEQHKVELICDLTNVND